MLSVFKQATSVELADLIDPTASGYAGDVSAAQAYAYLAAHQEAAIVDVRTQPEWQFVGLPDMRETGHEVKLISWKIYPSFTANEVFAAQLEEACPDKEAPVFFLCRSGGRSLDAAIYATTLGYRWCFNIADGFEGDQDSTGKRGQKEGWKASGLPWQQT